MPRLTKIVLSLFLVLSCGGQPWQDSWSREVEEFQLANGMTFLLLPHGNAPIFTAFIRFRAGGLDEETEKSGLAHFLEHMAFKGTEKIGTTNFAEERKILDQIDAVGEELSKEYAKEGGPDPQTIVSLREKLRALHEKEGKFLVREEVHRRMLEAGGDDYNATTSKDMTTYFVSLPSDQIDFWAEWESQRIFYPVFREFYEEKDVVMEERRSRIDNDPDGRLYEAFLKTAYEKSPYRWPTIGSQSDLVRLSPADLRAFWKKHYMPSNAVGVIVGKFDRGRVKKLLGRTFGKIPKGDSVVPAVSSEPENQKESRRVVLREPSRPRFTIGYHKPTLPDWDDYLFDLMNEILGEGRASRLYRALILEAKVASQVSTESGVPGARLPNLFTIDVSPLGNHSNEECLAIVDKEIQKIQRDGIDDKELARARNRLTADLVWRIQTNAGLAAELSYFQVAAGDWRYLRDYGQKIAEATPQDIQRIARTYLIPERRTVAEIVP